MAVSCRSCGAPIIWVTSRNGKPMPLDAKPEKRIVIRGERGSVVDTYTSHFATCPNADEHRRKQ